MVSPTLAILAVMAQNLARRNEKEPRQIYKRGTNKLCEPLTKVAERQSISFPVLLYNISPIRLNFFLQAEYNIDKEQVRLYVEAMERATVSESLAYLMAAGLNAVYKGNSSLLQKMVFDKGSACLLSCLVYAQNRWTSLTYSRRTRHRYFSEGSC